MICGHPECEYCWPLCHYGLVAEFLQLEAEHEHGLNVEDERALGPWPSRDGWTEEADIEFVPIEAL